MVPTAAMKADPLFAPSFRSRLMVSRICWPDSSALRWSSFPLSSLANNEKVRGTTVAELGNRNRPLDMIVYKKDGENFLLMANSARGVMKISTKEIDREEGITERVSGGGTAGQTYDTIEDLKGVQQLDRLSDTHGVIVSQIDGGKQVLSTIALP